MQIKTVGVLGCGLMGAGIAQVSAAAGYKTIVREVDDAFLQKGLGRIKKFLDDGVAKGKVTAEARDATLGQSVRHDDVRRAEGRATSSSKRSSRTSTTRSRPTTRSKQIVGPHTIFVVEHLVAVHHRTGGGDEAAGSVRRPALLQPGAADEARRGDSRADHQRRDVSGACSRSRSRSARSRSPRPIDRGFIVNRLLVPYLLDAIRCLRERARHARGHRQRA